MTGDRKLHTENNEHIICKVLQVEHNLQKGILNVPHEAEFVINNDQRQIAVKVEQNEIRKITLTSEKQLDSQKLYGMFQALENLLMIFDGQFIPISSFNFLDSDSSTEEKLAYHSKLLMSNRLSYFNSADFLQYSDNGFISFSSVLSAELFSKWRGLLNEFYHIHSIILYSLSSIHLPVDVKCAFLIESAEPLVEIIKARTNFFGELKPGERGTSLSMCLDAIIKKYGEDIFDIELKNDFSKFLSILVNSRVNIMHIKKIHKEPYLNGKESVLYATKLFCLYRRVLFELLGIGYSVYNAKMSEYIRSWDSWANVLNDFLSKKINKNNVTTL